MEYDISWLTSLLDDEAHSLAINITATVKEQVAQEYGGKGLVNTNWKPGGAKIGEGDGKGGEQLHF
jgi:hypothetical protein